jgi:drug/metabolite transporter (DMT)-like permease
MVLISAAGFATLAIFIKIAYAAGANITMILAARFALASFILWALLKPMGISPRVDKKTFLQLCLMGGLGYGSMSLLFALAVKCLPASLAEIELYTYPALVSILAFILGEERFTWIKGWALSLCFTGLLLILGVSFDGVSPLGLFFGLSGAIVYSVYIIISNRILKKTNSLVATTYVCTSAAVVFFISGLFTHSLTFHLPLSGWLSIMGIAFLATVVGILGFFVGLTRIGAANASIISTAEPLITVILSVLILGEHLTSIQILGAFLIIASIIALQVWSRHEPAPSRKNLNISFDSPQNKVG